MHQITENVYLGNTNDIYGSAIHKLDDLKIGYIIDASGYDEHRARIPNST